MEKDNIYRFNLAIVSLLFSCYILLHTSIKQAPCSRQPSVNISYWSYFRAAGFPRKLSGGDLMLQTLADDDQCSHTAILK